LKPKNESKDNSKSSFNFFVLLEDTIYGIVEFIGRFFTVSIFCIFRPSRFVSSYRMIEKPPSGIFPRPYTYLILCVFTFLKGLEYIPEISPKPDISDGAEASFLTNIYSLIDKLGETTTIQIIISVFPTVIVILLISFLMAFLHKYFIDLSYRKTSYVFSYIFGSQIIGALFIIVTITGAIHLLNLYGMKDLSLAVFFISLGFFLASSILLLLSAAFSIKKWFNIQVKHRLQKIGINLLYFIIVVGVAFAYFYTIAGAYSHLKIDETELAINSNKEKEKFILKVYRSSIKNDEIEIDLLVNNQSKSTYLLHDKGSVFLFSAPEEVINKIKEKNEKFKSKDNHDLREFIMENIKKLTIGYNNFILSLSEKDNSRDTLIQAGEKKIIQYKGELEGNVILGRLFEVSIKIPIARVDDDGTISYDSVIAGLSKENQELYANLEREHKKIIKDIDKFIKAVEELFNKQKNDEKMNENLEIKKEK